MSLMVLLSYNFSFNSVQWPIHYNQFNYSIITNATLLHIFLCWSKLIKARWTVNDENKSYSIFKANCGLKILYFIVQGQIFRINLLCVNMGLSLWGLIGVLVILNVELNSLYETYNPNFWGVTTMESIIKQKLPWFWVDILQQSTGSGSHYDKLQHSTGSGSHYDKLAFNSTLSWCLHTTLSFQNPVMTSLWPIT